MDLNSGGTTPKRSRSKSKVEVPSEAEAKPATAAAKPATPRARKAKPTQSTPAIEVTSITAIATPDEGELLGMIATAAYYIAQQRNFTPGHELDDWLAAERQIRTLHA